MAVVSKGFQQALKITGIIGIVTSLSIITDTLGVLVGLISFFLVQGAIAFFKDPVRALLPLGITIINGIISGLEILANALLPGDRDWETTY